MWSSARLHLIFRWIQCWWLEGDVKKTFVKCFFSFVQSQITNNIKGQVCFSSFSSLCFGVSEKGKGSWSSRGQFVDLTTLAAWCWGKPSGLVGNPLWGWVPVTEGGECGNRVSRMGLELAVEAARVSSGGVQALEQQLPPATQLEEMPEHQEHQIMHQNN